MAKKQVIRLTEGDLHKIIKESVNKVLTEIDWRTCTSAALERSKRSGYKSDLTQKDIEYAAKKGKESQSKDKEKFNQDFSDYFDGKTKYVKGKGWVKESVNNVLSESRKPQNAYFGGYFFEGVGFDRNGNPIYYSQHLPIEVMDMLGWRKSQKWGRCGYASNWNVCHALEELGLPFGDDEE